MLGVLKLTTEAKWLKIFRKRLRLVLMMMARWSKNLKNSSMTI